MPCLKLKVSGKVQGVGFRYSVKQWADENNVFGLVKNLSDQTVLVNMYGETEILQNFLKWLNFDSEYIIKEIEEDWSDTNNFDHNFQIIK